MTKPKQTESKICPTVEYAFGMLGKKWTGLIIHVLGDAPTRFSELLKEVPSLSSRLLAERLRELECEGIVTRQVIPEKPVKVEYTLTEKGRSLIPIMQSLADWAYRWHEDT